MASASGVAASEVTASPSRAAAPGTAPAAPGGSTATGVVTAPAATGGQAGGAGGGWVPDGKGHGVFRPDAPRILRPGDTVAANGISYHGGPIMLGTTHVYFIFYGNWSGDTATTILPDWAKYLGGSDRYNVNTTYTDGSNHSISNSVTYGGATFDNYSQGTMLDDTAVAAVVSTAIGNSALPLDHNGVYFVLTSTDVDETTGFCTTYCGWHTAGLLSNVVIQYAFVGNTLACPNSCEGAPGNDPNGNEGADGMASIMAHELDETVTDPQADAWYDSSGNEVGDLCSYTYGSSIYTTANGSIANVHLGARDFLLQEEWINAGGGSCSNGLPQLTRFFSVTPCRLIDTRNPPGPTGGPSLLASQTRTFALAGACGIPATAKALSVNVTTVAPASAGFLTLYPTDQQTGGTSTINFSAGRTLANNAVLRLSGEGSGSINVLNGSGGTVHLVLDVNGYFQ